MGMHFVVSVSLSIVNDVAVCITLILSYRHLSSDLSLASSTGLSVMRSPRAIDVIIYVAQHLEHLTALVSLAIRIIQPHHSTSYRSEAGSLNPRPVISNGD